MPGSRSWPSRSLDTADGIDVAHIGFRIAEPLDIYLEGVPIWADRLGADVVGTKRIPASEHFQDRVGAFVEMAQVWLGYRGREIELEVFDIHSRAEVGSDALSTSRSLPVRGDLRRTQKSSGRGWRETTSGTTE